VVSGAAALYLSANPTATNDRVKYALTQTAHPLNGLTANDQGAGVIDVAAALNAGPGVANQGLFQPVMFPSGVPSANDLQGVDTTGSNWTGSNWTGSNWTGSNWTTFSWDGSNWTGSNWTGSNWTGSNWTGSNWTGSNWTGSNWTSQYWS
jgi:serine protease AprX